SEEAARGRLCAVDSVTELRDVRIHLQDAALGPQQLDGEGVVRLDPLAQPASAVPEKEVLGHLLADRAGPAQAAAVTARRDHGRDRVEVEAAVARKGLVLG